jgi:agmatine deiminase
VYSENSNLSHDEIQDMAYDYLGLTNYYLVSDPLDDYIEHIDCWGKFLAPDKILMGEVAPTDYRYDDFEAMADFWANQTSSYGNKFKVYRTYSPNGQPYTNSLILNKKVYVPIVSGTGSEHNSNALEVYQNALPGYEIIGVENNTNTPWEGTDALHCRTYQVPDFEMLRISHLPILDTVDFQDSYEINADIYTLSISENIIEDAFLNYNINDGDYNLINLNNIDGSLYSANITNINENDKVCYYLEATNTNDKHEMHPITGENNPHCFYVRTSVNNDIAKIESQIKAFPNPVYDRLSITVNNLSNEDCRLQIIDINGKIILEKNVSILNNWERISIDLSEIDSGLYFVRLLGNNIARSQRFIKL